MAEQENEASRPPPHDYYFKIILVGDPGVGKTSLLLRYTENSFSETGVMNVGVDFKSRLIDVDGKRVYMDIWDTAGQERFRTISASFYKGAHGIILVYDITDEDTQINLPSWMKEIDRHLYNNSDAKKMLVGNKLDCEGSRKVEKALALDLAVRAEMTYQETSAKEDINVDDIFITLSRDIIASGKGETQANPGVIKIGTSTKTRGEQKKGKCC